MKKKDTDKGTNIIERSPVIVVMGHIDHGKSTLLDYIRSANTVAGEAGGITQHTSAYEVEREREGVKKRITFIDTPGHAAFQSMRARGAKVGDIAILVVAADDGINTQTLEALKAIKEADISYVVAINKMDKPGADLNKTISSLIENEVYLEGYGGDIPYTAISAKTGEHVDELLDTILLVAELEELKADRNAPATGVVIESHIDPKAGVAATLIIKEGTLKTGEVVVAGKTFAPVRVLRDFMGKTLKEAYFSSPIELVGFDKAPEAGSTFRAFPNKKEALKTLSEETAGSRDEALSIGSGELVIPIIIKTDVLGTAEAVLHEISKIPSERVKLRIMETGIGSVSENDVRQASSATDGIIMGFNVAVESSSKDLAERQGVTIVTFTIIYELSAWLEEEVARRTPRMLVEETSGKAKVLKVFNKSKNKQVIGGRVDEGIISTGSAVNVMRRDEKIGSGKITGMQQQKAQASSVSEGNEFGAMVEARIEIAPGDYLEAFVSVEK